MSNNIMGAMVLLIGFCIILMAGVAAIQLQTDTADTVIGNNSEVNATYETMKDTTGLGLRVAGYVPYFLLIVLLIVVLIAILGLVKVI
jgi:flagellar biosynthesis protein FlhB